MSFVAVQLALGGVVVAPVRVGTREPLWARIRQGLSHALADDLVRPVLGLVLAVAFAIAPFIGLVPAFAITVLGGGPTSTSLMVTCQGAGAVLGALVLGSLAQRFGRRRVFEATAVGLGLVAATYWLASNLMLGAGLLALLGATYLAFLTGASSAIQARVPSGWRGRVASLYSVAVNGAYSVGLLVMGPLGDRFGLRTVMVGSALLFTASLAAVRALRPGLFAELDDAVSTPNSLGPQAEAV